MKQLYFECQSQSPFVHYNMNENILEIGGKSFAKYSRHIYEEVLEWLNEYIKNPNEETIVSFKFEFYDTSSAKLILEILKKLDHLYNRNKKVKVLWHYPEDDDDIEEAGEIYGKLIDTPVKVIPFSLEPS